MTTLEFGLEPQVVKIGGEKYVRVRKVAVPRGLLQTNDWRRDGFVTFAVVAVTDELVGVCYLTQKQFERLVRQAAAAAFLFGLALWRGVIETTAAAPGLALPLLSLQLEFAAAFFPYFLAALVNEACYPR